MGAIHVTFFGPYCQQDKASDPIQAVGGQGGGPLAEGGAQDGLTMVRYTLDDISQNCIGTALTTQVSAQSDNFFARNFHLPVFLPLQGCPPFLLPLPGPPVC